jgi:hypothetical protein
MQISFFPINSWVKIEAKGEHSGRVGQVVGLGPLVGDVRHTVHVSPPLAVAGVPQLGITGPGTVNEVVVPASGLKAAGAP